VEGVAKGAVARALLFPGSLCRNWGGRGSGLGEPTGFAGGGSHLNRAEKEEVRAQANPTAWQGGRIREKRLGHGDGDYITREDH